MCILIQRWYQCRTRQGVRVSTEEQAAKGEAHFAGKFVMPCSTPLIIPPLYRNQNGTFTDEDILPCYGAWDEKVEWYNHPCPACRGEEAHLHQGRPVRVEWRQYPHDKTTKGHSHTPEEHMETRAITERAAESLAKTLYCWVDMHWSKDWLQPNTAKAPDLTRQILSTRSELGCISDPSHGPQMTGLDLLSHEQCSCEITRHFQLRNAATKMRRWMNYQTATGYDNLLHWAHWQPAKRRLPNDFDLKEQYDKVPVSVWNENPFFEFRMNEEKVGLIEDAEGGLLFGLDAGMEGWLRRTRQERLSRWNTYRYRTYPVLEHCEPLTGDEVAVRYGRLCGNVNHAYLRVEKAKGALVGQFVLEKVAEILAHDSGLRAERMERVMDQFLDAFVRVARDPRHSAPRGAATVRPSFEPPYMDALFQLVFANGTNFFPCVMSPSLDAVLREDVSYNVVSNFPHWVVPESTSARMRTIAGWREEYWREGRGKRLRIQLIARHIVKYIPGLFTDKCTSCKKPNPMRPAQRGPQLCRECRQRIGYQERFVGAQGTDNERILEFGDQVFRKMVGHEGPMDQWICFLCAEDFNNDEPPFEVPAEIIRCHGTHRMVVGHRCLKAALFAAGNGVGIAEGVPQCLTCRGGLCIWDENILRGNDKMNDDDHMDTWAYFKLYRELQPRPMHWGTDPPFKEHTIFPDPDELL